MGRYGILDWDPGIFLFFSSLEVLLIVKIGDTSFF